MRYTIWASNSPAAAREFAGNCKVKLLAGEIALSPQHRTVLERKGLLPGWRLACLSRVEEDLTIEVAQFDNIVLADETPFRFTPREGWGIAVDLGSTTIVSQLLDLSTGRVQARPDRYQSAGPPWGRHHVTYQLCDTVGRARRTPHHPGPRNGRTTCPDPDSTGPGPYRPHPHRRQQCDAPPVLQTRRRSAGRLPIRVAG